MDNKPIMIDGIDVSGCENLSRVLHNCQKKGIYDKSFIPCKCKKNCEYKQLQRSIKENNVLKQQMDLLKLANNTLEIGNNVGIEIAKEVSIYKDVLKNVLKKAESIEKCLVPLNKGNLRELKTMDDLNCAMALQKEKTIEEMRSKAIEIQTMIKEVIREQ